jgi:putative hydrolase of the HAD superfamily
MCGVYFNKMKFKAVIFDLFGTLVDTSSRSAYSEVLSAMAEVLQAPREKFVQLWFDTFPMRTRGELANPEHNIQHICDELKINCTESQIQEAIQLRLKFVGSSLVARKDAIAVLKEIKRRGMKIGLISDCSWEVPVLWEKFSLSEYIDFPVFSCSIGMKKPDPRIYKQATDMLGVHPQDCIYVGDGSSNELSGAKKAGMFPVMIRVPYEKDPDAYRTEEEEWHGPVVSSLSEVLGFLE